jgi:heat shock protein 5
VGVLKNGKVEIIDNEKGKRKKKSYVDLKDKERLIGDEEKKKVEMKNNKKIFDEKSIIGRRFDEKKVKEEMKNWKFNVISDGGKKKIKVN